VIAFRDVPPYVMLGDDSTPKGINSEGLRRRGFDAEVILQIKRAYKVLYRSGNRAEEAAEKLLEMAKTTAEIQIMADFVTNSSRGIVR
jgi:UDP-N-acetylglucosamine acyltransferase